MPGKKQFEVWQLIEWLKGFAEELGKTPTLQEIDNEPSMPSKHIYCGGYFDSYLEACRKAELKPNINKNKEVKKEQIIKGLNKYFDENGEYPTFKEMDETEYLPSHSTMYRIFENKPYKKIKKIVKERGN